MPSSLRHRFIHLSMVRELLKNLFSFQLPYTQKDWQDAFTHYIRITNTIDIGKIQLGRIKIGTYYWCISLCARWYSPGILKIIGNRIPPSNNKPLLHRNGGLGRTPLLSE